ncbi:SDR family oxidoreductase [uncultured Photobacterium sp.]|uniref:SDR family NAD(P)-dependent oxidoreductase n=1 Tax=uncultured Photobacterium sp. TaxID=173973 RepID=UPI0026042845|nr:SDR family oxidoreductase [uncultured Photobacterium sp.]
MMKKILITGGNGDLAKMLIKQLSDSYIIEAPLRDELDVTSINSVDQFFKNREFDIVINSAGTLYSSTIIDSDPELWIKDINVNLIGTYLVTRSALLKNKDTLIINISSTAAFNSYNDWTSYCSSKAGVIKISQGLQKDNYNVVTLCPGAIDTKLRDGLSIINSNVMTLEEGTAPIIKAIALEYNNGDIIFYRKNMLEINPNYNQL